MNNDSMSGEPRSKQQELDADKFAAEYLVSPPLNWGRDKLLEALNALSLPTEAQGIHPSLEARRAQVVAGYDESSGLLRSNPGSVPVKSSTGPALLTKSSKPTVLWSSVVHGPQPSQWPDCKQPTSDNTEFTTEDESVWLYYSFDSGPTGREGLVQWISPSGAVHFSNSFQLTAPGTGCHRWFLSIRGYPPATMPGSWQVRIVYDGIEIGRYSFNVKSSKPVLLWSSLVHGPQPSEWSDCKQPASDNSEFTTDDESVWLYYSFDSGPTGREGSVQWISPSGAVQLSSSFQLAAPGTSCGHWFLGIRGYPPATMPGPWQVRILYDGVEVGRRLFNVKSSKPMLLWSSLVHGPQPSDWPDCKQPASDNSEFALDEESVWLYYSFDSGPTGREGSVQWISPSGALYFSSPFQFTAPGTSCGRWFIGIRGAPPATMAGPWQVRIVYDAVEVGRRAFIIK